MNILSPFELYYYQNIDYENASTEGEEEEFQIEYKKFYIV